MRTTTPTRALTQTWRVVESPRHRFAGELAHDGVELPPLSRPHVAKEQTARSFAQSVGQHQ